MHWLLRIEKLAVGIVLGAILWKMQPELWLVVAVLIAPDLSMAGYLWGPRAGAWFYNAAHSYIGPAGLGTMACLGGWDTGCAVAALWALHIVADRALEYGLKHMSGFRDTHLGRIGRD